MTKSVRVVLAIIFLSFFASGVEGQTIQLTVHVTGNTTGTVSMVSGGLGACTSAQGTCTFDVNTGATVRIAAPGTQPGRFSGGTGPAAGCSLSTCSFTMTAAADLTATFTLGDGPVATLTMNPGGGFVAVDATECLLSFPCTSSYLQGSVVHLETTGQVQTLFLGYSGSNSFAGSCGASLICDSALTANTSATANFLTTSFFFVTPTTATGVVGGPAQQFSARFTIGGGVFPIRGLGSWESRVNMPFAREFLAAATLGGKIYALGGSPSGGTSAASDVAAYTPQNVAHWDVVASMLEPRAFPAAVAAGGLLYAIGGYGNSGVATSGVERYDPGANTWTPRAPMSSPRYGLVAGVINGVIYAAGGKNGSGTPVATLEAYDPVTNTWTTKAPMPAARGLVAGGAIDGVLYVVGGTDGSSPSAMVQAYDPASNTWTTKAPMPAPLSAASAAVADGVLYVFHRQPGGGILLAYDSVADAWTTKAKPFLRTFRAAAELDGAIYAIGGAEGSDFSLVSSSVDYFRDSLRWSSSAPSVARVTQQGQAIPVGAGTSVITARFGNLTCNTCATFTVVVPPTTMSLDAPADGASFTAGSELTIGGWALNTAASTGTGVEAIHVYAFPTAGSPIFLGAAPYGEPRPDVGAAFGSQFTNSGFTLKTSALSAGDYTIYAAAFNALTHQFDASRTAAIHLTVPVSNGQMAVDTPVPNQVLTSAFEVGGWAVDLGAPTGTGVDAVQFYVFPNGVGPGLFVGQGSYGGARPDVGAIFGSRFANSGYHFTITGLGPGAYTLGVYARSTVTNAYSLVRTLPFTVSATALMSIDSPNAEATITTPTFGVGGWSIDRSVESTALSGTGVDALHVYAYPNPGSGQAAIFLGVAALGVLRPDVGSAYGVRYDNSGYNLIVDRAASGLAPGVYNIVVASHSAVSGTFNNVALVRVTLQ